MYGKIQLKDYHKDDKMQEIIDLLKKFRDDRNWSQFHTPGNLSKSLLLEAAELLENYQWSDDNEDIENVKDEIADVVAYALLLCDYYGFDLKTILKAKIKKNTKKYPVSKAYGNAKKYTDL